MSVRRMLLMYSVLTGMHCTEHACDELIDAIALLYKRHEGRNAALVVVCASEVREDQLLELVYLVLQCHQVRDRLVALIRVVDRLQTNVFLVFECA